MAIDLLSIEPHKVSRDLSGYITYIYGARKTGKTTFCSQTPGCLLLAFEQGYNALGGIQAQPVTSWGEMKQVLRQLKDEKVKERFKTVCIDTVDIAASCCEKYICSQNGVDALSKFPYGQGWTLVKREFEDTFRTVTQLGYAVVFISHDKDKVFKRKDGTEYNQTVPSCATSYNDIAANMADIYAYAEKYQDQEGTAKVRLIIRSPDNSADTGCRFKYMDSIIPEFNYQNVVDALNRAIDKEAELNNGKYITTDRNEVVTAVTYDYDALMAEFEDMVGQLMNKNQSYYAPRVTQIIEKYLGKGKKVSDTTLDQAEFLNLIVDEIRTDLLLKG